MGRRIDMLDKILEFDGKFLLYLQNLMVNPIITPFFQFITKLGDNGLIWILISLGLLLYKQTRKVGILALISLLCVYLIDNVILKNLFERIRPYEIISGIQLLIEKQSSFSFPSGHTGSAFAAAIVFLKLLPKRYGISAIIVAVLIGFSRLYLGVHFPIDVIFGALIGIIIGNLVCKGYRILIENGNKKRLVKEER
jgi:undecaprenyl-diphosphatase